MPSGEASAKLLAGVFWSLDDDGVGTTGASLGVVHAVAVVPVLAQDRGAARRVGLNGVTRLGLGDVLVEDAQQRRKEQPDRQQGNADDDSRDRDGQRHP